MLIFRLHRKSKCQNSEKRSRGFFLESPYSNYPVQVPLSRLFRNLSDGFKDDALFIPAKKRMGGGSYANVYKE